jgi:adenylosuccinate synthase
MTKLIKCINGLKAKHTAILGAQWGDEGKGKLVDILAENYSICARFNGNYFFILF